jgi:hypothetical protein
MANLSRCHRRGLLAVVAFALAAALGVPALQPSLAASASLEGLQPGEGLLTVTSSPLVASRIAVGDVERNTASISGLPLIAGDHLLCFAAPEGYIAPPCRTVDIRAGELTSVVGTFEAAGKVSVVTEPVGLEAQITIDGVARDRGAVLVPIGVGDHRVCAEPLPGYRSPECRVITVVAGALVEVSLAYEPESVPAPDPDPQPAPIVDDQDTAPQPGPIDDSAAVDVTVESSGVLQSKGPTWTASVTVAARRSGGPASGIIVGGVWGASTSTSCLTGPDGSCSMAEPNIHNREKAIAFRIVEVDGAAVEGPTTTVSR